MITFEIHNDAQWQRETGRLLSFGRNFAKEADSAVQDWGRESAGQFRAKPYPPELPNQRYVRTGRFGRSWTHRRVADSALAIRNAAAQRGRYYARYVTAGENATGQARIHQNRWWVARKELERLVPKLATVLERKFLGAR